MAAIAQHAAHVGFGLASRDNTKTVKLRGFAVEISVALFLKFFCRLQMDVVQAKQFGSKCTNPYCIISLDSFASVLGVALLPQSTLHRIKIARTPARSSKDQDVFWSEEFTFE